jgi:hypothetical protein
MERRDCLNCEFEPAWTVICKIPNSELKIFKAKGCKWSDDTLYPDCISQEILLKIEYISKFLDSTDVEMIIRNGKLFNKCRAWQKKGYYKS